MNIKNISTSTIALIVCLGAYAVLVPIVILEKIFDVSSTSMSVKDAYETEVSSPPPPKVCVSKGIEIEEIINRTSSVVFMTPAKGGGTTLKFFAHECSPIKNHGLWQYGPELLNQTYNLPTVSAHHVWNKDNKILDPFRHASSQTLFFFSYREETSRIISAIRFVVRRVCNLNDELTKGLKIQLLEKTNDSCTIAEDDLLQKVINNKGLEVGWSNEKFLNCDTYKVLRDNLPTMLFIDYRTNDEMMVQVARKHCPDLLDKLPFKKNAADDVTQIKYVKLSKENEDTKKFNHTVELDDWLRVKGPHLERVLRLHKERTCESTTRRMEAALASCNDHMVRIDDSWIG